MSVPICILTGFLGSGKTTLLRHLLMNGMDGRRVAVIVNEFGEIGLDGRIIESVNIERMIELNNGCICCSMSPEFVLAVEEIITFSDPEVIVIETTGIADPWSLVGQVRGADYPLDSVVTVVDAANLEATLTQSDVVRWQIEAADFLVLNKLDLVSDKGAAAYERLRALNERAVMFETIHGALNHDVLFAPRLTPHGERDRQPHTRSGHVARDGFESFTLRSHTALDRKRFEAFLAGLPPAIYRAKGFVHCTDATWPTLFQHVAGRLQYEWTRFRKEPEHIVEAVFIGKNALTLRDQIAHDLEACAADPEAHARWRSLQAMRLNA